MKPFVSHFILHGSMATLDYCKGWSDVDTLVVVKSSTMNNFFKLLELRSISYEAHKLLYRIDPLQHHGLIFISEDDLDSYPSYYLPIPVLKNSVTLINEANTISVGYRESKEEMISGVMNRIKLIKSAQKEGVLKHHAYYGEFLLENYKNFENGMYQMKYYLGGISLLPTLILGVLGQECYKRDSFRLAKSLFSTEAWESVEKVERIRNLWPQKETHPYPNNKIPNWLQEELGKNYFFFAEKFLNESMDICQKVSTC